MPLSRYHLTVPLPNDPDRLLLYSTRKASLAILDRAVYQRLAQGETPTESLGRDLERLGLWVTDPAGEEAAVFRFVDDLNQARTKASVSVILGMACNFACRYCYEGELKSSAAAMTADTIDQAVRFLGAWCRKLGRDRLVLSFYGGEPLLYPHLIRRFATLLKPALEADGIGFGFTLVTNGSLLTPQLVEEFSGLGLLGVRPTIDGPEECHNQTRPYKNGAPSFATIVDNLRAVCDLVKVDLGGNFTRDSYHRFPELLDSLLAAGIGPERLGQINFTAAMMVGDNVSRTGFTSGCASVNEPWHAEAVVTTQEAILSRGFKAGRVSPSPCMIDLDDALVINHDGGLYKCPALIGHERFKAGDIWQGLAPDLAKVYCRGHWQKEEKCRACLYLPLCFGGCRYAAYQREGGMERVDCQEEYYRAALPELLRPELRYRHGLNTI